MKNILFFVVIGLSLYFISSCNKDDAVNNGTFIINPFDEILRTDETGKILGGDYTDWCMHQPVDTFTYVKYLTATRISSHSMQIKWATSKEYHNSGFYIQRSINYDTNYITLGYLPGSGTSNDSIIYYFTDTTALSSVNYFYRLKIYDNWGNYKYFGTGINILYGIPNYSFGPAYPNPASSIFIIPFSLPRTDTVSIFFIKNPDTVFLINKEKLQAGSYQIDVNNNFHFGSGIKRLYIKCSSIPVSDSCKSYGDIQFAY
jgi:hypothetical protein